MTANCCHPGVVATGFAHDGDTSGVLAFGIKLIKPFVLTPEKGARTSVYLASSPDVADVSGRYFVKCKEAEPTAAARDRRGRRPTLGRQRGADRLGQRLTELNRRLPAGAAQAAPPDLPPSRVPSPPRS